MDYLLLLSSIVAGAFTVLKFRLDEGGSIALLGMLLQTGMSRRRGLVFLGGFALMAPLGMTISGHTGLAQHARELTAVVVGIFMHISTTILFESSDLHRFNRQKMVAIVVGTALGGPCRGFALSRTHA